jgi:phosphoglycerate kinase
MANTFLASQGFEMQKSLVEEDRLDTASAILERAGLRGIDVLLPTDVVVTSDLSPEQPELATTRVGAIPEGAMAVDIGPDSLGRFVAAIGRARSLFWNGPMGVFEKPGLETGSFELARAVGACPGFTVIGGGETAAVANQAGATDIDHISTGGGASLQLLAGRPLPGVEALRARGTS